MLEMPRRLPELPGTSGIPSGRPGVPLLVAIDGGGGGPGLGASKRAAALRPYGWFMEGLSESLMFYDLPERWWRAARTTNRVERLTRTLRMRLRPMGTFHDRRAAERALFGQLLRWHLAPQITHNT